MSIEIYGVAEWLPIYARALKNAYYRDPPEDFDKLPKILVGVLFVAGAIAYVLKG